MVVVVVVFAVVDGAVTNDEIVLELVRAVVVSPTLLEEVSDAVDAGEVGSTDWVVIVAGVDVVAEASTDVAADTDNVDGCRVDGTFVVGTVSLTFDVVPFPVANTPSTANATANK